MTVAIYNVLHRALILYGTSMDMINLNHTDLLYMDVLMGQSTIDVSLASLLLTCAEKNTQSLLATSLQHSEIYLP